MFVCIYAEAYNKQYKVHLASHCKINLRSVIQYSWSCCQGLFYNNHLANLSLTCSFDVWQKKPQACWTFPLKPHHCWCMFPEVNGSLFSLSVMHLNKLFFCVLSTEEELKKLRDETNVETLKQELEKEKSKRVDLEQKMNEILRSRSERWCSSTVKFPTTTFGYILFSFS